MKSNWKINKIPLKSSPETSRVMKSDCRLKDNTRLEPSLRNTLCMPIFHQYFSPVCGSSPVAPSFYILRLHCAINWPKEFAGRLFIYSSLYHACNPGCEASTSTFGGRDQILFNSVPGFLWLSDVEFDCNVYSGRSKASDREIRSSDEHGTNT